MKRLSALVAALALVALALVAGGALSGAAASPHSGASARSGVARPRIVQWPIPYGHKRKREMAEYSQRHYGHRQWKLIHPHVIVEHMAEASTAASVYNTFAPDVPDVELHELPNVCSQFVISSAGKIFQLVSTQVRCRHTVGLNWTAIGIEHAGFADSDALDDPAQMQASLRLTQYLRCHYGIPVKDVIGHNESLSSPYHHELVPSLKRQTHGDWKHSSMTVYRRRLRTLGAC